MKKLFNSTAFKKAVIAKRTKENISLLQASKEIGIPKANLFQIETGRLPNLNVYASICLWLSVPITCFFDTSKINSLSLQKIKKNAKER